MLDTTTFVGLDVHARSIKAVSLDVMTGEVRCATFGYDAGAVAEWVRSVDPKAKCVYESGVTGFDLQKRLSGLGVDCVVGVDWQHLFGRFREGQPRFPELDRRHVAQRRVDPEVVVPVHVVRELGP